MKCKGHGRVRAPENVGARRDLGDNKPIDSTFPHFLAKETEIQKE